MGKRDKILRAGIFLLALLLSASCGYFAGARRGTKTGAEQTQAERKEGERRIAVVDMDEGVRQGGETVQYASKLLPYSGVEYTVTGLQDARNGVETGLYSAYVVIPSDFSQSVQSINGQPLESKLAYTIDSGLDDAGKEEAARKVASMAQNMNDSLTKVYLSSVMKEFHNVQDATGTIMENDERDAELLDSVDAGDLIELVELPEMAEIENNVTSLDLAEEYEKNAKLVDGLGTAYQEFIQNGQKDLDKTKKRSEEALSETDAAYEAFAGGKAELSEFSVAKPDMGERYKESKQKIEDAIKAYDSYLEQYNAANAGGNKSALIKMVREYETIETKYQDMLKPYLTDGKKEYEFEDTSEYRKELAELLAKELGEDMLADKDEKSWKPYLEKLAEKIGRGNYYDENYLVYIKERDLYEAGKTGGSEEFLEIYKSFAGGILSRRYTVEQILSSGLSVLKGEKGFQGIYQCGSVKETAEEIRRRKAELEARNSATKRMVSKSGFFMWRLAAVLAAAAAAVFGGYTVYSAGFAIPEQKAVIEGNEEYIANDYVGCIDALAGIEPEDMSRNTKYILAVSYAKSESLKQEEIASIVEKLSTESNERELDYWICLGRRELKTAESIAMALSDDKLLIYAYMKEADILESDTSMDGTKKQERISALEQEIEKIGAKYETEETEETK